MKLPDYHTQIKRKQLDSLHELQRELPVVCTDYFMSVAQTTSLLTRLGYAHDFKLFFTYLSLENSLFAKAPSLYTDDDFKKITARDIVMFQDYLSQYYKTVDNGDDFYQKAVQNHEAGIMRKLCAIRSLFDYLFKNGHVPADISTLVALPKRPEKPILFMEENEVKKMLEAVSEGNGLTARQQKYNTLTRDRDMAILMLFLGTGIRVSELVGIDIDDIDFDENAFIVTRKGGDQTILYFSEQVSDVLQQYLSSRSQIVTLPGEENAFFLSMQKRRITQRAVENLVKKYALVAAPLKKRLSPHKLRSTFGTRLYNETGDIYLVADVLGHADVNTTRRHYAAMSDERKREAAKRIPLPQIGDQTDQ